MAGGDKKTIWIVANWKSNESIAQAITWIDTVGPRIERRPNLKIVVCPTFVALSEIKKSIQTGNYPLIVGAQDLSPFEVGPYTGEEAAQILKEVVDLAIIGHSERKTHFGEDDEIVFQKVTEAKKYDIIPLVCVQDKNTPVPDGVTLIAYEPIFAIGTGNPDTPESAVAVAQGFKKAHPDLQVLYGGSVTDENAKGFLMQDDLSGVLVGGASLDPEKFIKIVEVAYKI